MPNWNDPGLTWNGGGIWPFFSATASDQRTVLAEIRVQILREGRDPFDVSGRWTALSWSTNAVGGFGSCQLTLPGQYRPSRLWYTDVVRVSYGPLILFEGRVEDLGVTIADKEIATTVSAFGFARLLDDYSVRRIWSKRDIGWADLPVGRGGAVGAGLVRADMQLSTGTFDPSDLTKSGVQVAGNGAAVAALGGALANYTLPVGLTAEKILGSVVLSGANTGVGKMVAQYLYSTDGSTWSGNFLTASSASFSATISGAKHVRLGAATAGAVTPTASDVAQWYSLRLLGTTIGEDATGGFYGGTILRDLIALVPDLTAGQIDSGSDFTIQAIERAVRDAIRSVVNEVAGYYTREWAVWEQGRFDWRQPDLDTVGYIVDVAQLSGMEIKGTVDGVAKTVYVLYADAASGLDAEASSASTDRRNPYVRNGRSKDELVRPGFAMTSNTSSALASRVITEDGAWAPVTGTITLPMLASIQAANGSPRPAFAIRGGDNIRIVGLPVSDYYTPGRNGENVFHVASSDVDLARGLVRLTLEGQTRTSDQLIARLAAVTRTLTS